MSKIIHFIWVDKYDIHNPHVIVPKKYLENIKQFQDIYVELE